MSNRHFFEDGAFYINIASKITAQGLLTAISKTFHRITNDINEIA